MISDTEISKAIRKANAIADGQYSHTKISRRYMHLTLKIVLIRLRKTEFYSSDYNFYGMHYKNLKQKMDNPIPNYRFC